MSEHTRPWTIRCPSTTQEKTRYLVCRLKTSDNIAKLKLLETMLLEEIVEFAEYTVSGALLVLNTPDFEFPESMSDGESSKRSVNGVDKTGQDIGSTRFTSSNAEAHQRAMNQTLPDCIAVASEVNCGLKGIVERLQTVAKGTKLTVPALEYADLPDLPVDGTHELEGTMFDIITTEQAFARLDLMKAKVMELYCAALRDWATLLKNTEPDIKALGQRVDKERISWVRCWIWVPWETAVFLGKHVVSGHAASKTAYEAAFSTATTLSPSSFACQAWQ
ncbi:hypothetical protein LTR10_003387 [Elasticomyces elasticus]|nr:hypothetical protein LTR10_003387 [Elasticomyces elasticus]KAK4969655.1 hypothetical protein LTR42_008927 [Elasticomyces elasticus]